MEEQILYKDYVAMIKNRAAYWSRHYQSVANMFARQRGIDSKPYSRIREKTDFAEKVQQDYKELFSVGNLAFCKAKQTYDPNKGKFSTWLYAYLDNHMRNFIWKEEVKQNFLKLNYSVYNNIEEQKTTNSTWFTDFLNSVSKEAKEMISVILNTPNEYADALSSMISNKTQLREHMAARGMKHHTINATIAEIREQLKVE
jgi:DNA-directed RNA polymerase specialized sigma subunit